MSHEGIAHTNNTEESQSSRGPSEAAVFKSVEHREGMLRKLAPEYLALDGQIHEIETSVASGTVEQYLNRLRGKRDSLGEVIKNVGGDIDNLDEYAPEDSASKTIH